MVRIRCIFLPVWVLYVTGACMYCKCPCLANTDPFLALVLCMSIYTGLFRFCNVTYCFSWRNIRSWDQFNFPRCTRKRLPNYRAMRGCLFYLCQCLSRSAVRWIRMNDWLMLFKNNIVCMMSKWGLRVTLTAELHRHYGKAALFCSIWSHSWEYWASDVGIFKSPNCYPQCTASSNKDKAKNNVCVEF